MKYPAAGDYQLAIQHPEEAFKDPELQSGSPEAGPFGLPAVISGAFAAVFPITTGNGKYAVRCWVSDARRQEVRYRLLEKAAAGAHGKWAVPFEYHDRGVLVHDRWWPVVKMQWVDGILINHFIERRLDDRQALLGLAEAWQALMRSLAEAGMAHGDLQHGNVIVTEDDRIELRLIDYDNVHLPGLRGGIHTELGHRNYQHPDVTENDAGPDIDRFPAAVIYTALLACAHEPSLWHRYNNGENMLFRADDFYHPERSGLFADLMRLGAARVQAAALREMCEMQVAELPAFEAFVRRPGVQEASGRIRKRRRGGDRRPAASRWERRFAYFSAAAVLIAAAAAYAAGLFAGVAVLGAAVFLLVPAALHLYHRRFDRRRAARLKKEIAFFDGWIGRLAKELQALDRKEKEVVEQRQERRDHRLAELREQALYDRLKYHFVSEVGLVEGLDHRAVVALKGHAVRTAYQARPERLNRIRKLAPETRARISLWRASLVNRYQAELPETLPVGEQKRLERFERARLRDIESERERLTSQIAFQQDERANLQNRLDELSHIGFGRYLLVLLRVIPDRDLARQAARE